MNAAWPKRSMADLAVMVALPGHAVLIRLDATDRRSDPDWSARVTNPIAGHDERPCRKADCRLQDRGGRPKPQSDHNHPVAARHVRKFADDVQKSLGRGTWSANEVR